MSCINLKSLYVGQNYPILDIQKKNDETMANEILTIRDVAELLKVTDKTIYRLLAKREIPAFKVGGSWRFSKIDIDTWIQARKAA